MRFLSIPAFANNTSICDKVRCFFEGVILATQHKNQFKIGKIEIIQKSYRIILLKQFINTAHQGAFLWMLLV